MFSKDRQQQGGGGAMMMASALKMMGLNPEIVEAISKGLFSMMTQQIPETLARQEYMMRRMGIWDDYLAAKAANHVGSIGGPSGDSRSGEPGGNPAGDAAG